MSVKHLYIRIYEIEGEHQFQLCAGNHEALMTSERYKTKQAMRKAIEIVVNRPISRELKEYKMNREDI
jgi:uncharacterized protein YegP (UPF0339 family)